MKSLLIVLILVACLLVPISCGRAPSDEGLDETSMPPGWEEGYKDTGAGDLPSTEEERMIVRTGDMSLVVEDVVEARDEIDQLAVRFNGYVVSSRISGEEQDRTGWISIRVPDDKFDQALAEIRNLAVRVTSESTDSQDVTEEYVDLQSRLRNAEATESQYLALLEKTDDVDDILRIYEKLSQVRRDIEQIKGRMQYLERISAMSLISVHLKPVATTKPLVRAGWNALEILKSALRGLVIFGQWLGVAAIWLLIFSPIWGTTLGIIYWRRRKKRA
jgi:hypothetical protein